jgi:hypothetical protein
MDLWLYEKERIARAVHTWKKLEACLMPAAAASGGLGEFCLVASVLYA